MMGEDDFDLGEYESSTLRNMLRPSTNDIWDFGQLYHFLLREGRHLRV